MFQSRLVWLLIICAFQLTQIETFRSLTITHSLRSPVPNFIPKIAGIILATFPIVVHSQVGMFNAVFTYARKGSSRLSPHLFIQELTEFSCQWGGALKLLGLLL
jgi:hypothetical protein